MTDVRREREDAKSCEAVAAFASIPARTDDAGNDVGVGRREKSKQSCGEEETDRSPSGEFVECFSASDVQPSPNERHQALVDDSEPAAEKEDGRENVGRKPTSSVEETVRDTPRHGLSVGDDGFGGSKAVRRRGNRGRVVPATAVEKARASERR